ARIMMPQKSGCTINIASHAGLFYSRGQGVHYAASKAGIIQLTRVLAFELGPFQIRINAIAPGGINTPGSSDAKPSKLELESPLRINTPQPTHSGGEENPRISPTQHFFWLPQWHLSWLARR